MVEYISLILSYNVTNSCLWQKLTTSFYHVINETEAKPVVLAEVITTQKVVGNKPCVGYIPETPVLKRVITKSENGGKLGAPNVQILIQI